MKKALQTIADRVNNYSNLVLLVTLILASCNEKGSFENSPESTSLQGVWLYSEFDYLSPKEILSVDATGFIEKHYFWLYNPTNDTVLLISHFDRKKHYEGIELLPNESGNYQEKKIELNWFKGTVGTVIYPKEGILGSGFRVVPERFRLNDSLVNAYFESRKMELINTIMLLKVSDESDTINKRTISFNKCNIYGAYLRSFEKLNKVSNILADSTIRTNDTLMEFYWNQIKK